MTSNGANKTHSGPAAGVARLLAVGVLSAWVALPAPSALGYNFAAYGGRQGRAGVDTGTAGNHDFLYSWAVPDNGTMTEWHCRRFLGCYGVFSPIRSARA